VEPLKQDHHYTFVLTKLQGSPVAAALFLIGREGGKGTIPLTYSLDKTQPGLPALKVSAQEDAFKQFLAYLGSNRIQLSFKTWDGVITLPETPAKADLESKAEPAREDDEDAIIDLIN